MAKQQHALGVGIQLNRTEELREKLIAEITQYERQLADLNLENNRVNFSMIQTYKELIHSRQSMLNHLPPSF
jgi:hypothetical protein